MSAREPAELVGYDRNTEAMVYTKPIPAELIARIRTLVGDDDLPGCLAITKAEADSIAQELGLGTLLPDDMDFFLEDSA